MNSHWCCVIFLSSKKKFWRKFRAEVGYPGFSPPIPVTKSRVSKLSERVPTPPRVTKLNDAPSFLSQSTRTRYETSGVFSDITADYSNRKIFLFFFFAVFFFFIFYAFGAGGLLFLQRICN